MRRQSRNTRREALSRRRSASSASATTHVPDAGDGFCHFAMTHLRPSGAAIDEDDRDLHDAQSSLNRAVMSRTGLRKIARE
jgi:hypothetical protein